jgi:hypothetical protein
MRTWKILALSALSIAVALMPAPVDGRGRKSIRDLPSSVTSVVSKDLETRVSVVEPAQFDQVIVNLGKKYVAGSTPGLVPQGWSCEPKGGAWNCSGSPRNRAYISIRGTEGIRIPNQVGLDIRSGKNRVGKYDLSPEPIERVEVIKDAASVFGELPSAQPGDVFMVPTVGGAGEGGDWSFYAGDTRVDALDALALRAEYQLGDAALNDRIFFRMPESATEDMDYRFTWDDPFGDRWIDVLAAKHIWREPFETPCTPTLTTCQERAVVGGTVCVCGCFPVDSWLDLSLDGNPIPFPSAASTGMIRIPLPEVQPGEHVISWGRMGESVKFEAVAVRGSIDQAKLKVGQSTELKFGLVGTEDSLPMLIQLLDGNVRIVGGNEQTVYTSGGADNGFSRTLEALGVGDFNISYQFEASLCPCTGETGLGLVDDSFALHPWETEGNLELDFLSGAAGSYPMTFRSDNVVTQTPWPPFEDGQDLQIEYLQLGMKFDTPGFGRITFEQHADRQSFGRFRDIRVTEEGGFRWGEGELELHTEFSTKWQKDLPLQVGLKYELGVDGFEMRGRSPGLGELTVTQRPGTEGTARIENLRKDAGGGTLFGDATLRLHVEAKVNF